MSMNIPVLYSIAPFDATVDHSIFFSYAGNQSVKNTLLIVDNVTLEKVYENTIDSFRLSHIIPADTLLNGKTYQAQIKVYDTKGNSSDYSKPEVFKCLSIPKYEFANLQANQTVEAANYDVRLVYEQIEDEMLDSFKIGLYDAGQHLLFQTDTFYNFDIDNLHYTIEGLLNNTSYYLRSVGETVSGIIVDTGYIAFTVEFIAPSVFSVVQAVNNDLQGSITVSSNIILIEGEYDGVPIYIDGSKIDLRDGNSLKYNTGFSIDGDFSLQIIAEDAHSGKPLIILGDNNIVLSVCSGKQYSEHENKSYIHLIAKNNMYTYVLDSEYFIFDKFQINLRRKNGLFNMEVLEVQS